jgi:threonine dehydrogenase-like Zn-dependent dehydrogenase
VKALLFEHNNARFVAARAVSMVAHGKGVGVGPLRLVEIEQPELPGHDWQVVRPTLAGICGSDLATLDSRSSRYFESLVSFPFVPGHEVVGHLEDQTRVVVEPVLGCATRKIVPPCPACANGDIGGCSQIAFGHLRPGLQTGYCVDTGGGWSGAFVAHDSQIHVVPDGLTDEAAVMVEPTACAIHAALAGGVGDGDTVVVLGAGTLGLCIVAALRRMSLPGTLVSVAKHPTQRRLAAELGADVVVEPEEVRRAVRRLTRSLAVGPAQGTGRLTGGADVVLDCVGSADSLADSLAVVRPRGRIVLVGMPGKLHLDLAPLWQREVALVGAYAYGREVLAPPAGARRTFDLAFELVQGAHLGGLVSARYPLERFEEAVAHAASAGRRGSVKVVFDLQAGARRSVGRVP